MSSRQLIFKPGQIAKMQEKVQLEVPEKHKIDHSLPQDAENISFEDPSITRGSEQISEKLEEYRDKEMAKVDSELEEYRKQRQQEIDESLEHKQEELRQTEEESKNLAFHVVQKSQEQAKQEMEAARLSFGSEERECKIRSRSYDSKSRASSR